MVRRSARAALWTVLAGCADLTPVDSRLLPPPERPPPVDEGSFGQSLGPCPALSVHPPVRLTAGGADEVGISIGAEVGGPEPIVAVAWGTEDAIGIQYLLRDGVRLGAPGTFVVEEARPVAVAPLAFAPGFSIAAETAAGSTRLLVVEAPDLEVGRLVVELDLLDEVDVAGMTAPAMVVLGGQAPALSDRVLVVGLDGDGEIELVEMAPPEEWIGLRSLVPTRVGQHAATVVAGSSDSGARIAWLEDGSVAGGSLVHQLVDGWTLDRDSVKVVEDDGPFEPAGIIASGDRAGLGVAIRSAFEEFDVAEVVVELDEGGWHTIGASLDLAIGSEAAHALVRQSSSPVWAMTRVTRAGKGDPGDVRLERIGPLVSCYTPTGCAAVTTDRRDSREPVLVALPDGFGVAWSDAVDGGHDVFYAFAECRPLAPQ